MPEMLKDISCATCVKPMSDLMELFMMPKRIVQHNSRFFDRVLGHHLSRSSLLVLRSCPIDEFFSAQSTRLHGSTLASLGRKGYLNMDTTKDGLEIEYYLNSHGHRMILATNQFFQEP